LYVKAGTMFTPIGITSSEPIRCAGLESAFENHASIVSLVGDLDTLLCDPAIQYLILDLNYDSTWIETQFTVRRLRPDIKQIVLGPGVSDEVILSSISAGARAYLDSSCGPFAVRQAVEAVIDGVIWAPRRLLTTLIDRLLNQGELKVSRASTAFSPRECQVLDLMMAACTNREIAVELGIEERTVKAYVANLMRKTGVDNRVSLSVQATQHGFRDQRILVS
jgi:DNA-binding NarL/FixJ family response regulator